MSDNLSCPLCEKQTNVEPLPKHDGHLVHCSSCGSFLITRHARLSLGSFRDRRHELSAFTRAATVRKRRVMLTLEPVDTVGELQATPVCVEEILAGWYPASISDRFDRILLNLAHLSSFLGDEIEINVFGDAPLLFARHRRELHFTLAALQRAGLIADQQTMVEQPPQICLTPGGWDRVAQIQRGRSEAAKTQAFVAMWFGNDADQFDGQASFQWSQDAFLRGFKPGVERAGFDARRIDFKEFNDDVTDEIVAEIRRSRFVIADFTGHRAGVYFEAGFAKGMNLPVIFTCHSKDIGKAHFDTNHYNHIVWSNFAELAEKLEIRIVATIVE